MSVFTGGFKESLSLSIPRCVLPGIAVALRSAVARCVAVPEPLQTGKWPIYAPWTMGRDVTLLVLGTRDGNR